MTYNHEIDVKFINFIYVNINESESVTKELFEQCILIELHSDSDNNTKNFNIAKCL